MTMGLIAKVFKLRRRNGDRVKSDLLCTIQRLKTNTSHEVKIFEISDSGAAFTMRDDAFVIDDKILLQIKRPKEQTIQVPGRIVSQKIYYGDKLEDLKHATYRFSVSFDEPILNKVLKQILDTLT